MRKTFDDQLFVSTSAGMMPTPVSENIIGQVREALQLLDSSTHVGGRFDPASSERTFRLSMTDLTEALLLPALEEVLQRLAPGIRIESYFTTRKEVPEALASSAINLAIDAPLIDDPPSSRSRWAATGMPACCVTTIRLPKKKLTIDDYLRFGHIHVSSRPQGPGLVDAELNQAGLRRSIQTRVQHYLVAPLIAMRTDLVLTAPLVLFKRYDARILEVPFDLPDLRVAWLLASERDWGPGSSMAAGTDWPSHAGNEPVARAYGTICARCHQKLSPTITTINFLNDAALGIL